MLDPDATGNPLRPGAATHPAPSARLSLAPGISVAYRPVNSGDEDRLAAEEAASLADCTIAVRRRAAAARIAARDLLAEVGWPDWSLPRRIGRGPPWPDGLTGSLSHCGDHAAAALAPRRICAGIGIDIEPAEPLEADVLDFVATPEEAIAADRHALSGRVLFCAKEAAYKAVHPLDGYFLEPREVVVDLRALVATTPYGRTVSLALHVGRVIVALGMAQDPATAGGKRGISTQRWTIAR